MDIKTDVVRWYLFGTLTSTVLPEKLIDREPE